MISMFIIILTFKNKYTNSSYSDLLKEQQKTKNKNHTEKKKPNSLLAFILHPRLSFCRNIYFQLFYLFPLILTFTFLNNILKLLLIDNIVRWSRPARTQNFSSATHNFSLSWAVFLLTGTSDILCHIIFYRGEMSCEL